MLINRTTQKTTYNQPRDIKMKNSTHHTDLVHETIDGHQWIIYTAYNNDIVQISDNHAAYLDVYCQEDLGQLVIDSGVDGLTMTRAYFAMSQDLNDAIAEIISQQ